MLPLLWCVFHIVKSLSNLLLGRAVDRFGPRPFIYLGWFVYAGVYIVFGLATTAWEAWALFLIYALFYGLTEPAEKAMVAMLVGPERKGLAYGWYNFAIGIATLPSSLIFGALYQFYGSMVAFGCGAALALIAATLLMGVRKQATNQVI
jgi:MFS family permease